MKLSPQASKALNSALSQFKHKFDATPGFIDMRGMSKNYSTNVIPWKDINSLLDIIIGAPQVPRASIDPTQDPNYTVSLEWTEFVRFGILTEIQRDMIPNHIYDIDLVFDGKKISVILAMEDPVTGCICPFDGHHTARVLDRQGWSKAPVAVLRAPKEMIDKDPMEARKYLMRVAGEAFLSINLTHKKGVGGYDKFIIMRDYGDPDAVAINNILNTYSVSPVRIARFAKDISHYNFMWEAYELMDRHRNPGRYLDLALDFHTNAWPAEQVYGATMVGLAHFFQKCERAKVKLDSEFFNDLTQALKTTYKLSKFTHDGYKKAYEKAHPFGSASDQIIVTCGFVHTYNKHVSKQTLYTPEVQFTVK